MCGFAGFYAPGHFPVDANAIAQRMGERLRERGPDDAGQWVDPGLETAIAFRRLAIIDLSEQGHQPMLSADGRFLLAINGEIYNYRQLRPELEQQGHPLRGQSDTEVLLEGISAWGLEQALERSVGMFALALVDTWERKLFLARDRLGEKPLYYGWSNGHFFFGSELKGFQPHPAFSPEVDPGALTLYIRHGYVPAPYCILAGFRKLLPGHVLSLPLNGSATGRGETLKAYWSIPEPKPNPDFARFPVECVQGLEALLRNSVRLQMVADVPVGVFLSGGIDSSTVASLMQAQCAGPVKTFCIGFSDPLLDESGYAERIAAHLGTEHTTWRCDDSKVLELAQQIPHAYAEPFADDSQLPTLALARLTRQQVTVCLTGDGGDELFHGYGWYQRSLMRWRQMRNHPAITMGWRHGLKVLAGLVQLLGDSPLKRRWSSQLQKARNQWLAEHLPAYYRHRISVNKTPELFLSRPQQLWDFFDSAGEMAAFEETVSWLSYLDLHTYFPDHILAKVDRAAMAFSLETRIPLLDHRVVEYAATMPEEVKCRRGLPKWPLRQILGRYVPAELTERPKMGFCAPLKRWLRGPLREWAEEQLNLNRLRHEGLFQPEEVRRLWDEHQRGRRDRAPLLWNFLVFQAWHASFLSSSQSSAPRLHNGESPAPLPKLQASKCQKLVGLDRVRAG